MLLCPSKTPRHLTHTIQPRNFSVQGFEDFRPDFIAVCSLSSLQCFDSYEIICYSDGIFLFYSSLLCAYWCESDWVQNLFELLSPPVRGVTRIAECVTNSVFDESSNIRSFAAKTLYSLLEHFVDLPVIGMQSVSEILTRLHFGLLTFL